MFQPKRSFPFCSAVRHRYFERHGDFHIQLPLCSIVQSLETLPSPILGRRDRLSIGTTRKNFRLFRVVVDSAVRHVRCQNLCQDKIVQTQPKFLYSFERTFDSMYTSAPITIKRCKFRSHRLPSEVGDLRQHLTVVNTRQSLKHNKRWS